MQLLSYFMLSLLCCLHLISSGISMKCDEKQYSWPVNDPKYCCNKCQPGECMARRSKTICDIECTPCVGDRFTDSYNVRIGCKICKVCSEPNQEYESHCSPTNDSVCRCRTGYRCSDPSCMKCVPVVTPTLSPSTAATTTPHYPPKPIQDTVWFLVIIALLCIGIAVVVLTKIKPFLKWIRSNYGSIFEIETIPVNTEDDDVSKPVQEVCGKCDQPIEICVNN